MLTDLGLAFVRPTGMIVFGALMLRQPPDPRATWDYRQVGGRLAIIVGLGWTLIGFVRLATVG